MSTSNGNLVVTSYKAGAVAVGAGTQKIALPFNAELVSAIASVGTASTAGAVTADIKKNGSTVFTGVNAALAPSVPATAFLSAISKAAAGVSAGQNVITPTVNDGSALATVTPTDYLTVDVTAAGTGASDLTVTLFFVKR